MSDLTDNNPPYHIVNSRTGKHQGPFSSYLDACLARLIGGPGWDTGEIMNRFEFTAHLDRMAARR
jgi:hypothetical protein